MIQSNSLFLPSQSFDSQPPSQFDASADDYRNLPTTDFIFTTMVMGIGFGGFVACSFMALKLLHIV
ncbi:MAG: hypothetical protein JWR60_1126 [Polaromonas sp.]|nr:hypothetical protein [Polaromonas sp.]